MKANSQPRRARLSLDLSEETKALIEDLCVRSDTPTITDLIKKSVALFDIAVTHKTKGGALIFRHKDGKEERLLIL